MDTLNFIKPINDIINYREEQKELIRKALEISNGDPLNALQYFVTCMNHEGHAVEFELVFTIPANEEVTITLPIKEIEPKDELGYYVSWGNGLTYNTNIHTYERIDKTKDYHVRLFGLGISGFGMQSQDNEGYKKYLTKVISFGKLGHTFTSLEYAFYKCENNFTVPHVLPSNITNTCGMFWDCINFNQPLTTWDTLNVTNMISMFFGCISFNQPLTVWNVSNVTNMRSMFSWCKEFNQPFDGWNTTNVTDMSWMFIGCTNFNQPLTTFNTSNVTNMTNMFYNCTHFNESLTSWNTSNVTNMCHMFACCTNFNQPLTNWDTSNVTDMSCMFCCCTIFNQPLTAWNTTNVTNKCGIFVECNISEENKPQFKQ
jgi:surface protein